MQDHPKSSFVYEKQPIMKPLSIKLKEKSKLSLDGVNSEEYPKGETLTSKSTLQRRLFEHLIESGKAEPHSGADESDSKEGKKVSKPKETKSKKSSKKSSKKE